MKAAKDIWNLLNGNKTTIGMIVVLVTQGIKVFMPEFLTAEQFTFMETIGMIIGGGGIIHKGVKNQTINNAINKANIKK